MVDSKNHKSKITNQISEWVTAYIGLGSNLGDRERTIRAALQMLGNDGSIEVTRISDLQETAPLGQMDQPNYLNGVAEIRTKLGPQELLRRFKATEAALGRAPHAKWAARTIDLDLLLYGDRVIRENGLIVPHPDIHLRSFVLDGLCQLRPDLIHPLLGEPVSELSQRLRGGNFVPDPEAPQLISVAGIIGVGKTTLAKKLGEVLRAPVLFEPYDTNPFLREVYAGKSELALDSQLYFLVHRTEQIGRGVLRPGQITVTDYVFDQEMIYARRLLNPTQLALYEKIYRPFAPRVTPPTVVIYLHDWPARLPAENSPTRTVLRAASRRGVSRSSGGRLPADVCQLEGESCDSRADRAADRLRRGRGRALGSPSEGVCRR